MQDTRILRGGQRMGVGCWGKEAMHVCLALARSRGLVLHLSYFAVQDHPSNCTRRMLSLPTFLMRNLF